MKIEVFRKGNENQIPSKETQRNEYTKCVCACGNTMWEVIYTADYETSIKCLACGVFRVVHSGQDGNYEIHNRH